MDNPDAAAIIQGTGGLRKLRWALPGSGKSGSMRVLYVDFIIQEKVYMIDLFTKNEKDNLSDAEKSAVKKVIQSIQRELRK